MTLVTRAIRAGLIAQDIDTSALQRTVGRILRETRPPRRVDIAGAECAARIAARLLRTLGMRGNCITTALIMLALLREEKGCKLNVGFSSSGGGRDVADSLQGHAWINCKGQDLPAHTGTYTTALSVKFEDLAEWTKT